MMLSTAVLLGLTLGGLEIDSHNWAEMATLTPTTVDEGGLLRVRHCLQWHGGHYWVAPAICRPGPSHVL